MEKTLLILLLIPFFCLSQHKNKETTSNTFIFNGNIDKQTGNVYLVHYDNENRRLVDSSNIINGKFTFKGFVDGYSQKFYIKLNQKEFNNADSLNAVQIQAEHSEMHLFLKVGQFSKYVLTNCKSCDELEVWNTNDIHKKLKFC